MGRRSVFGKGVKTLKTSLSLPDDLWREATIRAVNERRNLQDVVAEALRLYLKTARKQKKKWKGQVESTNMARSSESATTFGERSTEKPGAKRRKRPRRSSRFASPKSTAIGSSAPNENVSAWATWSTPSPGTSK